MENGIQIQKFKNKNILLSYGDKTKFTADSQVVSLFSTL